MRILSASTIILSAFLLFSIQFMLSKFLLPYYGGSASVWNISMMFFQVLLLAGYVYAHVLGSKLPILRQTALHCALLGLALITLIWMGHGEVPDAETLTNHPAFSQLMVMTTMIGLPFFVLSATAPLMQKWYLYTSPNAQTNVYTLYAISNIGSITGLLAYPLLIEHILPLNAQFSTWTIGFGVLVLLFGTYGSALYRLGQQNKLHIPTPVTAQSPETSQLSGRQITQYVLLAFIPSILTLAVTVKITTDIAAIPLLWAIPLGIYLLSFIIAFSARPQASPQRRYIILLSLLTVFALIDAHFMFRHLVVDMVVALLAFGMMAYACHRSLYERRPEASQLTAYYLYVSLGGALGGVGAALIVPLVFAIPVEFSFFLIVGLALLYLLDIPTLSWQETIKNWYNLPVLPQLTAMLGVFFALTYVANVDSLFWLIALGLIAVTLYLARHTREITSVMTAALLSITPLLFIFGESYIYIERNYFGIVRIAENDNLRKLNHGSTQHGVQSTEPQYATLSLAYYSQGSPIDNVFTSYRRHYGHLNITTTGLGAGSVACLTRPQDKLTFIEIDPAIIAVSTTRRFFTFIEKCNPDTQIIQGDGRLMSKTLPDHSQDLIVLDAFSSDSIPLHLITVEAMRVYLDKLKDHGSVAVHISNRYFNLLPELGAIARDLKITALSRRQTSGTIPNTTIPYNESIWVILSHDQAALKRLQSLNADWQEINLPLPRHAWSDQNLSPLRALKPFY